jgi:hypothetical protein
MAGVWSTGRPAGVVAVLVSCPPWGQENGLWPRVSVATGRPRARSGRPSRSAHGLILATCSADTGFYTAGRAAERDTVSIANTRKPDRSRSGNPYRKGGSCCVVICRGTEQGTTQGDDAYESRHHSFPGLFPKASNRRRDSRFHSNARASGHSRTAQHQHKFSHDPSPVRHRQKRPQLALTWIQYFFLGCVVARWSFPSENSCGSCHFDDGRSCHVDDDKVFGAQSGGGVISASVRRLGFTQSACSLAGAESQPFPRLLRNALFWLLVLQLTTFYLVESATCSDSRPLVSAVGLARVSSIASPPEYMTSASAQFAPPIRMGMYERPAPIGMWSNEPFKVDSGALTIMEADNKFDRVRRRHSSAWFFFFFA